MNNPSDPSRAPEEPTLPATPEAAARLLDLIDELAARVAANRAMGVGDVSIANGIRAQFMDRWLDEWCEAVRTEPIDDALRARLEASRKIVLDRLRSPEAGEKK